MKKIEGHHMGMHISQVAKEAIEQAQTEDVFFTFNGIVIPVTKTSTVESVCAAYDKGSEEARIEYENSPQRAIDQANREKAAKEARQKFANTVAEIPSMDEMALRELKMPWPDNQDEFDQLFKALATRSHDYGTCVYAMSIVAEAAFNLMAKQLGCTGFQSGCADMDILRRTRGLEGPFAIINANDMVFPQYDIRGKVDTYLDEWKPWAAEQAKKKLAESPEYVHPDVKKHWEALAASA